MKTIGCVLKVICVPLLVCSIFSLMGCYQINEKDYYSNKNNFITGSAIVDNIIFDEENHQLYFWLSGIDEAYQDNTFKLEGANVDVLIQNNLLETIKVGSHITFASAPRYFGDGYCMPIVALSYNDEVLLPFDVGYANFMSLY